MPVSFRSRVDPIVSCTAWLPAPTVDAVTREQREIIRNQIDALMRERLEGEPSPRGPRHIGNPLKTPQKVKSRL